MKWPYNGCDSAYDLGWKHGTEDIDDTFRYRWKDEDIFLHVNEIQDYKQGYKDARRNW